MTIPDAPPPTSVDRRAAVVGAIVLGLLGLLGAGLVALVLLARAGALPGAGPTANPSGFAYGPARAAPALQLTDQDRTPFSLSSLAGRPVLVFFGYTHCPDVCPATIGIVDQALATVGPGPRVVFVSIDPERDDAVAMKSYLRYLPPVYTGLSGTPAQVRANADAWGVRYAKVETGSAGGYSMAHTADVYLVDAQGRLRAHFPFGTQAEPIAASLASLLAETPAPSDAPPTPTPTAGTPVASPSVAPVPTPSATAPGTIAGGLVGTVVSSEVWAGGQDPVILSIADGGGTPLDGTTPVDVQVLGAGGAAAGDPVRAIAIRPWGETVVYFVATVTIPSTGQWQLSMRATDGATGSVVVNALDQGTSAPLGGMAPDVHTPTLGDVGGVIRAVTTQPDPDPRLSQTSTSDARAAGRPYVIVIDSSRFRVSPLCGRAIVMVRYLLDRWPDVTFIHLEPFEYQLITNEPVLSGSLTDPPLNQWARAFGLGDAVWPATDMPWAFVVDSHGVVRAKYTGIIGSTDVDVIISLMENNGVIGG